jgi:hypothetical protein
MQTKFISILAIALTSPAWGAGHGPAGVNHGASVSQTAHMAKQNGSPVGASVRDVARSKSQGPNHASANAIQHVQNSPGRAASHSVLASGSTSPAVKHTGKTKSHKHR